jgi:hypothetical protein
MSDKTVAGHGHRPQAQACPAELSATASYSQRSSWSSSGTSHESKHTRFRCLASTVPSAWPATCGAKVLLGECCETCLRVQELACQNIMLKIIAGLQGGIRHRGSVSEDHNL